ATGLEGDRQRAVRGEGRGAGGRGQHARRALHRLALATDLDVGHLLVRLVRGDHLQLRSARGRDRRRLRLRRSRLDVPQRFEHPAHYPPHLRDLFPVVSSALLPSPFRGEGSKPWTPYAGRRGASNSRYASLASSSGAASAFAASFPGSATTAGAASSAGSSATTLIPGAPDSPPSA